MAIGSVPVTAEVKLTPVNVPPKVIVPVPVIGPPVKVSPLTVPAVLNDVTPAAPDIA